MLNKRVYIFFFIFLFSFYFILLGHSENKLIIKKIENEIKNAEKLLSLYSKNVININTYGYRANVTLFSNPINNEEFVIKAFTQGSLKLTGRQYDIAIVGNGFLKLKNDDNEIFYTRNGQLYIDKNNVLRHISGMKIVPEIKFPKSADTRGFRIKKDGVIHTHKDYHVDKDIIIRKIELYQFRNIHGLKPYKNIFFIETKESGKAFQEKYGHQIEHGFLEESNADYKQEQKNIQRTLEHIKRLKALLNKLRNK